MIEEKERILAEEETKKERKGKEKRVTFKRKYNLWGDVELNVIELSYELK